MRNQGGKEKVIVDKPRGELQQEHARNLRKVLFLKKQRHCIGGCFNNRGSRGSMRSEGTSG
eukprot:CAMPEP_0181294656 /NCGR_PEP_ID=MMETSP1101-20121128/3724_1 /TAXON_ID=46948 /ORGANISM="Rhodomonas abbreviata, Strain Caron Lab Isolate" /LENGTH=60 /DNA_ID=CAMNT_0023399343 /DNA_START=766 /DNA_END=944 /DNA_ORIENTATION=+